MNPLLLAIALQAPAVTGLRVEYLTNPLGIDVARPRFSWKITSAERNTVQAAYELQVTRSGRLIWDTGRTPGDSSVFITYEGPALESRRRYEWRVRVWDATGRASAWSGLGSWEMGLGDASQWTAAWIGPAPSPTDSLGGPAPLLRRAFRINGGVARARLYATSLGLYEAYLNGTRVGDQLFTPGWTSYNRRLQYQTYDVTKLLRPGDNALGAVLGDGWYRGQLGFNGRRNVYGKRVGLRMQLEIIYQDGKIERVTSDSLWKTAAGPILASDIYGGETYDARAERTGWSSAPYDDRTWAPVVRIDPPESKLLSPESPPVRRIGEIRPVNIRRSPSGETVFDLGQNFSGWARLRVRGPGGTVVTMRFAEVLDRDGNLYTANLRRASQTDRYTLKGGAEETYEPHFTFHGFRYVGVTGLPAAPDSGTITGIVVSSDLEQTGTFETSDSLLNRLQQNIVWGQRSNFLDVPTDCPQRDERLGWTGDAQVFAPTAAFNLDVSGFFAKWLGDVAADQDKSGALPWVIPDVLGADSANASGTAGWSDATVIVPWTMYVAYGDRGLLARQYPSMRAWVEFERRRAGPDLLWQPGWQFGDWLALHSDDPSYPGATTQTDFIATAYFAHSTDIVARAARALGNQADAAKYEALFREVRAAFNREFVSSSGRVGENTQTAYALAIAFDLLPDSLVPEAGDRLAADVRRRGMHLTTGFLGTPQLLPVLSAPGGGHLDVAYALLMQKSYPSWLYPITRGATTMWERWDGIRPDSTFEDAGMNSFNHYAFGAVGDWMYRNIGGIRIDAEAPGGKRVSIAPRPGGGLTHARASLETLYGRVVSAWKLDGQRLVLDVTVPPNTAAAVTLSETTRERVSGLTGVRDVQQRGPDVIVTIGSGDYEFTVSGAR